MNDIYIYNYHFVVNPVIVIATNIGDSARFFMEETNNCQATQIFQKRYKDIFFIQFLNILKSNNF